ncbi:GDSL-type esterase/lipase family protein [Flammeovirga aprica]|uniref:SGNH hydrolase-type esterase domain-containing protein n=1 Tax=Flammeovirga aprica JL-4 TaxID=694437 RepID=A0A7X9P182_9BACT|nr:GDSL-type esterase/lipase family protein [Flammeovirga aprica]NME67691.1 hypothetical protein [Flammeovirga aprica JL-4]
MKPQSNKRAWKKYVSNSVKAFFTIIFLCGHSAPTSISSTKKPFEVYDFIRMDLNKIQVFGDSSLLETFFDKLSDLEAGDQKQVEVLHIGDSHIQADFFSGWVREKFYEDARFPMKSRGFFFPYKAAKTNNPYNFSVSKIGTWEGKRASISYHKSNWGLAAISARTTESFAALTINVGIDSLHPYKGNIIEVYYPTDDPTQFTPIVMPLEPAKLISKEVKNGKVIFTFDKPISKFRFSFEKENASQNQFILRGFGVYDQLESGLSYSSSGVNGAKVTSYLRCKAIQEDIQSIHPDLLIISLGTNDAFHSPFNKNIFIQKYTQLIQDIRKVIPDLPIILTTPGDNFRKSKYLNKDNAIATKAMYQIAQQNNVAIWDFYHVMGGLSSIEQWSALSMTSKDRVHLSRIGYQYQGELFYRALMKYYNTY